MRLGSHRDKVFGPGRAVPLDRNAKARIMAYARAWSRRNRRPGQHRGPITRAFLDVLEALLWGFHNSRTGICFPSYERIAEMAECARSTVAEALKVLEWAGVLSWQHRITGSARPAPTCSAALSGAGASSGRQTPTPSATRRPGIHGLFLPSPKIGPEHRTKRFLTLYWSRRATRTARSNVPLPDSAQLSQQRIASNKEPAPRTEPQNPAHERT